MAMLHLEGTHRQLSLPTGSPRSHSARPCGHLETDPGFFWPDLYSGVSVSAPFFLEGDCPGPDQVRSGPSCPGTPSVLGASHYSSASPWTLLVLQLSALRARPQRLPGDRKEPSRQTAPSWPPLQMSCLAPLPGSPKSHLCPDRDRQEACRHRGNSPPIRLGVDPRPNPRRGRAFTGSVRLSLPAGHSQAASGSPGGSWDPLQPTHGIFTCLG